MKLKLKQIVKSVRCCKRCKECWTKKLSKFKACNKRRFKLIAKL